jgi:predicted ABC-class ATPase
MEQLSHEQLSQKPLALHDKGYKAYKDIRGSYQYPDFRLTVDHVQGDPFATPSRISVLVDSAHAGSTRIERP